MNKNTLGWYSPLFQGQIRSWSKTRKKDLVANYTGWVPCGAPEKQYSGVTSTKERTCRWREGS